MTDKDIIKALECCGKGDCENCNSDWSYSAQWDCMRHIERLALDLINRQKQQIDRFADIGKMYSEVRAEAIREFEDKFLDVCQSFSIEKKDTSYFIWADDFAKIIKEMTEATP